MRLSLHLIVVIQEVIVLTNLFSNSGKTDTTIGKVHGCGYIETQQTFTLDVLNNNVILKKVIFV